MNNKIGSVSFSHVALCVSDLAKSMDFYCNVFGFEIAELFEVGDEVSTLIGVDPPISIRSQFIRLDQMAIDLMQFSQPRPSAPEHRTVATIGMVNFAFRVSSLTATCEKIIQWGGAIDQDRLFSNENGMFQYCRDPDGNRIEIMSLQDGVLSEYNSIGGNDHFNS